MALKRFLRAQNSFNILILAKGYVPTASMPMHGSLVNTIDLEPPELKYYLFQILKSHANIKFGRLICPKYSKTLYKAIKIKYFERSSRTQKHPSLHSGHTLEFVDIVSGILNQDTWSPGFLVWLYFSLKLWNQTKQTYRQRPWHRPPLVYWMFKILNDFYQMFKISNDFVFFYSDFN